MVSQVDPIIHLITIVFFISPTLKLHFEKHNFKRHENSKEGSKIPAAPSGRRRYNKQLGQGEEFSRISVMLLLSDL